jgi:hypothetical protein
MNRTGLVLVLGLAGVAGLGVAALGSLHAGRCGASRCATPNACVPPESVVEATCGERTCVVKLEAEPAVAPERSLTVARVALPDASETIATPATFPPQTTFAPPATVTSVFASAESAPLFDEIHTAQKQVQLTIQDKAWMTSQLKQLRLENAKLDPAQKAALRDPRLLAKLQRSGPAAAVAPVRVKLDPAAAAAAKLAPPK